MNRAKKNRLKGQLLAVGKIAAIVALVAMLAALVWLQWGLDNPTTTTTSNVAESTTSTAKVVVTPTIREDEELTTTTTVATTTRTTEAPPKRSLPAVSALPDPIFPTGVRVITEGWDYSRLFVIECEEGHQFYFEMAPILDEDGSTPVEIPGLKPFRVQTYPKVGSGDTGDGELAEAARIQAAVIAAW